jgi:hypothetical protein
MKIRALPSRDRTKTATENAAEMDRVKAHNVLARQLNRQARDKAKEKAKAKSEVVREHGSANELVDLANQLIRIADQLEWISRHGK